MSKISGRYSKTNKAMTPTNSIRTISSRVEYLDVLPDFLGEEMVSVDIVGLFESTTGIVGTGPNAVNVPKT
jgi:hypothetical protein